jgi:prevent-host-death family protein
MRAIYIFDEEAFSHMPGGGIPIVSVEPPIWTTFSVYRKLTQGRKMSPADHVKPISYLNSDAAQIVKDLTALGEPLLITQDGEAKFVIQDVCSYEKIQQTLALLKLLAFGKQDIERGKFKDAAEFLAALDNLDRNGQFD